MASALISGLINNGYAPEKITVTDPDPQKLAPLQQQFSVNTSADNAQAIQHAQVILLAVKPQV
ncbi:Pyrroline-5-carboxylate reductase, partial [hydrothermal vent metagenome]